MQDNNIVVTFVVNEGPQDIVESLQVEGNDTMSLDRLAPDGLRIAPGQPFAQKSIDDDRNKIVAHYLDTGYLTASSTPPHNHQPPIRTNSGSSMPSLKDRKLKTNNVVTLGRVHNATGSDQQGHPDHPNRTAAQGD